LGAVELASMLMTMVKGFKWNVVFLTCAYVGVHADQFCSANLFNPVSQYNVQQIDDNWMECDAALIESEENNNTYN
jgi:hypothetical protein